MDLVLILIILVVLYLIFLHIYYSDSNLTLQYRIPESRSVISDTVFNTNVGKVEEMKKKLIMFLSLSIISSKVYQNYQILIR